LLISWKIFMSMSITHIELYSTEITLRE
jgi:hypothetical protein